MPRYDFRCKQCKHRFEVVLSYEEYGQKKVSCPSCGSADVQRCINRVRIATSEESRIENLVDPTQLSGIEDDPRALGQLMRKMGREMGEDLGPEFNEVVSRLEKGQDPEQIEKEMPELGDLAEDTSGPMLDDLGD